MSEVSCQTLHMDTDVPSYSSFSVPELYETNSGKDMVRQWKRYGKLQQGGSHVCGYDVQQKARQRNTAGHKVETSVLNVNCFHCQNQLIANDVVGSVLTSDILIV